MSIPMIGALPALPSPAAGLPTGGQELGIALGRAVQQLPQDVAQAQFLQQQRQTFEEKQLESLLSIGNIYPNAYNNPSFAKKFENALKARGIQVPMKNGKPDLSNFANQALANSMVKNGSYQEMSQTAPNRRQDVWNSRYPGQPMPDFVSKIPWNPAIPVKIKDLIDGGLRQQFAMGTISLPTAISDIQQWDKQGYLAEKGVSITDLTSGLSLSPLGKARLEQDLANLGLSKKKQKEIEANINKINAATTESEARTALDKLNAMLIPLKSENIQAEVGQHEAAAAADYARIPYLNAETQHVKAETKKIVLAMKSGVGSFTPNQIQSQVDKLSKIHTSAATKVAEYQTLITTIQQQLSPANVVGLTTLAQKDSLTVPGEVAKLQKTLQYAQGAMQVYQNQEKSTNQSLYVLQEHQKALQHASVTPSHNQTLPPKVEEAVNNYNDNGYTDPKTGQHYIVSGVHVNPNGTLTLVLHGAPPVTVPVH